MPKLKTESFGTGDQSWLGSTHALRNAHTVAPDPTLFPVSSFPNGVPSGTPLGLVTATGKVGPYTGNSTEEVQTLTEGGSGLTSFTLTFRGQTTAAIAAAAPANGANSVQSALEALSTIGVGNVVVTGSAGGPYTVSFQGTLSNSDVPQLTATPTGGTGTVTVATTTAGGADTGSDGRTVLAGFLATDQPAAVDGGWPMVWHGSINVDRLPVPNFLTTGHTTTGLFEFRTRGV